MEEHLAILGHDLRNELSAISGLADIIESLTSEPEVKKFARLIQNHNLFMMDLVNGLVIAAKAGGVAPSPAPMSVWDLVNSVIAGLSIGKHRPPVVVAAISSLPELIVADGLILRQVFTNLVGNAVRFTSEGGVRLCLEYNTIRQMLRVTIADTGPGMSAEQLANLFEPDRQIHRDQASPGGHGLGLWIARRLIDVIGGTIAVQSLVGHGTVIALEIPCLAAERSRLLSEEELRQTAGTFSVDEEPTHQSFAGLRVLVADDVPTNRLIAATLLKRRGASVTLAEDGASAVRMAKFAQEGGRPFDVMVFDYHMPNMDGAQAAEILRKEGCVVPILCWTSASSPVFRRLTDMFTAVLEKPTEPARFYAVLERCINEPGQRGAQQQ
jgi:CheY-like chemotaxis protein